MTTALGDPLCATRLGLLDGVDPETVLRGLIAEPGLVVLSGDWLDGGLVVTRCPTRTIESRAALDETLGAVERTGAWFGWLPFPDDPAGASAVVDAAAQEQPWFGLYPELVRYRASEDAWYLESAGQAGRRVDAGPNRRWSDLVRTVTDAADRRDAPRYRVGALTRDVSRGEYCGAVEECITRIRAGDLYQANICHQLAGNFAGNSAAVFADLVGALRPARAALICGTHSTVVSASPELFLERVDDQVTSAPIKGTRPAVSTDPADPAATQLRRSVKERAENIMIVDLVRNDLGRVAATGSVHVTGLLEVEAHCGVWHLVSRVAATRAAGSGDADLLDAAFPPGSVTGAPKRAARMVIADLERSPRGVYTGAVGYLTPQRTELSVAIRTLQITAGQLRLGVGAGITASSVPIAEWNECRHKAAPIAASIRAALPADGRLVDSDVDAARGGLFETMLVLDGRVVALDAHLRRLAASVDDLWHTTLPPELPALLEQTAGQASTSACRLRLDVDANLQCTTKLTRTVRPVGFAAQAGLGLPISVHPRGVGRHKWADRAALDAVETAHRGQQVLFIDADGQLLETTRGSVFAVLDSTLVTPPADGRILPGTTRAALLDLALELGIPIRVRPLPREQLALATGLAVSGSLGGMLWVRRCAGRTWARPDPLLNQLADSLLARWSPA